MRLLFVLLSSLAVAVAFADRNGDAPEKVPLFEDDEIVKVTLTAPFDEIQNSGTSEEELPGKLVYVDDSGNEVTLEIKIRGRGKFRRERMSCDIPPLRLNFRKSNETLFANVDKIKLVTHCENRSSVFEQAVYKEYLAYRIFNILTDWSFRVRLLEVRYVEATKGKEIAYAPAFLIEDDKQLARRIGMELVDAKSTSIKSLDGKHTNLGSLFQYFIGNTDFSPIKGPPGESCCHNYVLFRNDNTRIAVPYDFDVTGLVNPPYAKPNPRLGIKSVKQRRYRGRCVNNDYVADNLELFRSRKAAIFELLDNLQGLHKSERRSAKHFIDEFYDVIDSEKRLNFRIIEACLGGR